MSRFQYLADKIRSAEISTEPFEHLHIEDFFEAADFEEIIQSGDINTAPAADDKELFRNLFDAGYGVIGFPGCTTDVDTYIKWHQAPAANRRIHTACEGFGVVLRLQEEGRSQVVTELYEFLFSDAFSDALAERFSISREKCTADYGIQKYLDGYEISPHPDVRRKALTFMVNVNSTPDSETIDHHTHYLKLKDEWRFVRTFWEGNPDCDRDWVPWDWCETAFMQSNNNSIVVFSPSDDTMHAVKASYDHRRGQRTQLYGNLWYKDYPELPRPCWESFAALKDSDRTARDVGFAKKLYKSVVPSTVRDAVIELRRSRRRARNKILDRKLDP